MNNLSKLIILIFVALAGWWCYDKFLAEKINFNPTENDTIITTPQEPKEEQDKEPEEKQEEEKTTETIYVYMLTTDNSGNQFLKPVKRPLAPGKDKLGYAVEMLLAGPNKTESAKGIYTEVPQSAKLISVTTSEDKVTINLTGSFGTGGGSDSTYSRMRQLIKTVLTNTNKPVYLQLDGAQADIIGGEGITVSQPLSEKSLDE